MIICEKCNEEYKSSNIAAHMKSCAGVGFRKCVSCNEVKSFDFFRRRTKGLRGFYSSCKPCIHAHTTEYRIKSYGLQPDEYKELKEYQNNQCAICGKCPDQAIMYANRRLAVDHIHDTNIPRGLLCSTCNTGLGMFQDSIELLEKAIEYLQEPPVQQIAKLKETESGDTCPIV